MIASRNKSLAFRAGILIGLLAFLPGVSSAQIVSEDTIEAGASQNYFYIEPSYDGTSIVLFGSVGQGTQRGHPFDVAVTIQGPIKPVTVWKKGRLAGLWVNKESLTFEGVPNYFASLSTRPLRIIASDEVRKSYGIGLDALALPLKAPNGSNGHTAAPKEFQEALIRLKTSMGLFSENSNGAIEFFGSRLFRSRVFLPAAAGAGLYRAKFYVFQDGKVTGETTSLIRIKKIGIEARLSSAATNYPWFYGLMAVSIAALAGGSASFMFRRT
jgi:uncharacterized protein (TIGR02186 family)